MPVHSFAPLRGRIDTIQIDSEALAGNLLGDPSSRQVAVYLPPGHEEDRADYPLLVDLAGFAGSGLKRLSWSAFGESVPQRLDRLIGSGAMGPVIVAFPDCFTSLGGNQYVNSRAMGNWEDFLLDEMLPALESRFPVRPGAAHRAVYGKSSGGYGALIQGLRHGPRWGAVACHSGDMAFDLVYQRDFPATLAAISSHGGDVGAYVEHLRAAPKLSGGQIHALMILAMAATYDPDPNAPFGIRLPVDPHTCELDPDRWQQWLRHDPAQLVRQPAGQANLGHLRALFIDCGNRDEYAQHYGARRFVRTLEAAGISHRYEEFADGHRNIDYRLDVSLPYLYEAIADRRDPSGS